MQAQSSIEKQKPLAAMKIASPSKSNDVLDLINNSGANNSFNELLAVKAEIKLLTHYEETLKQSLQQRMGEFEKAKFINGEISWKSGADINYLDTEQLLKDHPALYITYTASKPASKRFTIKKSTKTL